MIETWNPIKNLVGIYEVSDLGRIKSLKFGKDKILSICRSTKGYAIVKINKKVVYVHRLVAQAFIPNPYNKPEVNHKDWNKMNCCKYNLEWCSSSENNYHAHKKPERKRTLDNNKKRVNCIKDGNIINVFSSVREAANYANKSPSTISSACRNNYVSSGFKWEYV